MQELKRPKLVVSILVASSIPQVSNRWKRALEGRFKIGGAGDYSTLLVQTRKLNPKVILIDTAIFENFDRFDIDAVIQIAPHSKIIVLATWPENQDLQMKLVYIAGPFRGSSAWDIEENIRVAERAALEVWKMGAAALCPHTNTRFFQGCFLNF